MKKEQWQNAFPDPTEQYHRKVNAALASLPQEKERSFMKLNKKIAVPVVAMLMVFALGTGLIATGTIETLFSSGGGKAEYTEVPTNEELEKDLGYIPVIPDTLAGEYSFKEADIGKTTGEDENGNVLLKQKFISCSYTNGTDELDLYIEEDSNLLDESGVVVGNFEGIDIRYQQNMYKRVPAGYEMTEQDLIDKENGTYIFSEGETEEVFTEAVTHVTWIENGIRYGIMAIDTGLTKEQLINAAKDVIIQ